MAKIIEHPKEHVRKRIKEVELSRDIQRFIELFEFSLVNNLDLIPIANLWDRVGCRWKDDNHELVLRAFVEFLSILQFPLSDSEGNEVLDQKTDTNEINNFDNEERDNSNVAQKEKNGLTLMEPEEVAYNMLLHTIELEEKAKDPDNMYSYFYPAWKFDDVMEKHWGEDNPGKIIGKYLRAMYPTVYSAPMDDGRSSCQLPKTKFIKIFTQTAVKILKSITIYLDSKLKDDASKSVGNLFNILRHRGLVPISDKNNILQIKTYLNEYEVDRCDDDPTELMQSIFLFRTMAHAPQCIFELLLEKWSGDWNFYPNPTDTHLLILLNLVGMYGAAGMAPTPEILREEYGESVSYKKIPRVPWCQVPNIIEAFLERTSIEIRDTEEAVDAYRGLIIAYQRGRNDNGGVSPLTVIDSWFIYMYWWSDYRWFIDREDLDVGLLLSGSYLEKDDYDVLGINGDPEERTQVYLTAIEASFDDGLIELGCALLSFYLFTQCLDIKGNNYRQLGRLSRQIKYCLSSNKSDVCQKAIVLAIEMSKQQEAEFSKVWLESFLQTDFDSEKETILHMVPNSNRLGTIVREQVEEDLSSLVPLDRVSKQTKDMLINAEAHWFRSHQDIGRGQEDWGISAGAYVKPIESELVSVLKEVTGSDAYRQYRNIDKIKGIGKITLGPLLHLLKDFDSLPDELQSEITKTRIVLHREKKLIRRLLQVLKYRNEGLHSDVLDSEKYFKLRKMLFEDRLLEDFILALHP